MNARREPRYFPAQCSAGHPPFLALVVETGLTAEALRCPVCGADARMIPGAYYTMATRERFERVAAALHDARLTREQMASTVAWLDRAARDADGSIDSVLSVFAKVPGLNAMCPLVPVDAHERHGFVGLVLALLIAGATAPRRPVSEEPPSSLPEGDAPRGPLPAETAWMRGTDSAE